MYKPLRGWTQKKPLRKKKHTPFLCVLLPVVHHDPAVCHMTWMHQLEPETNSEKPFWHFSKLPTGLIPHPLYQTINCSEEHQRKGETDTLTLSDDNEFPTVSTTSPSPPSNSIPQPPSSHCVPHNCSHSKTSPRRPGSAVQPPMRKQQQARRWKTENEKVMRQRAQLEMLEWDLGQSSAGCGLKVKVKSGTRWELRGEFITRPRVVSC